MKRQEATLRRLLLGDDGSAERQREQQRMLEKQKEIEKADDDAMMYLAREVSKQQLEEDQKRVQRTIEKEERRKAKEARAAARAASHAAAAADAAMNAAGHPAFAGAVAGASFDAQMEEAIAQSLLEATKTGNGVPLGNGHGEHPSAQPPYANGAPTAGGDEALSDPAVRAFMEKRRLRQQQQRDEELQRSIAAETQRQLQLAQQSRTASGSLQAQELHHGLTPADMQAFANPSESRPPSYNAGSAAPYRYASPASRHMSSSAAAPLAAPPPAPTTDYPAPAPMVRSASPASRYMSSAPPPAPAPAPAPAPTSPPEYTAGVDAREDYPRPASFTRHPSPASRHMSSAAAVYSSSPPMTYQPPPPASAGEEYDPTHILHSDNQVAYKAAVALLQLARKASKGMSETESTTRDASALHMATIWLTQASHYLAKQREAKHLSSGPRDPVSSSGLLPGYLVPPPVVLTGAGGGAPAPMLSSSSRTHTPRLSDFPAFPRAESRGRPGGASISRPGAGPPAMRTPSPVAGGGTPMPVLIPMPPAAPAVDWACPVCTLVNKATFLMCEACGMPKP